MFVEWSRGQASALYRDGVQPTASRTRLEQLVRASPRTIDETCTAFAAMAAQIGERGISISAMTLKRWMNGTTHNARPVARRVAEAMWGQSWEELLGPPIDTVVTGTEVVVAAPSAETLLAQLLAAPPAPASPPATDLIMQLNTLTTNDLAQVLMTWLQRFNNPALSRRALAQLAAAVAVAGASPLFEGLDADGQQRLAGAMGSPRRLDVATLAHYEAMVTGLRHQADVLGPQAALAGVHSQRRLIRAVAVNAPDELRVRVVTLYAQLCQLTGWLLFNLGEFRNAGYYYDEARTAAHDAHATDLVVYILCTMSHMATWQHHPRVGIDHAVAAASWARQLDDPIAQAYAADVLARAYLADDQLANSERALTAEYLALHRADPKASRAPWWYFYDESFLAGTQAEHALRAGRADQAMDAVRRALDQVDPGNVHNTLFQLLFLAEAHILTGEPDAAVAAVDNVLALAAINRSARVDEQITSVRRRLDPWATTRAVHDLDDHLTAYRSGLTIQT
jgi:hypothetical protein